MHVTAESETQRLSNCTRYTLSGYGYDDRERHWKQKYDWQNFTKRQTFHCPIDMLIFSKVIWGKYYRSTYSFSTLGVATQTLRIPSLIELSRTSRSSAWHHQQETSATVLHSHQSWAWWVLEWAEEFCVVNCVSNTVGGRPLVKHAWFSEKNMFYRSVNV